MSHIIFIHSSIDHHLDCFHALPTVNSAAMNIRLHVSFELWFSPGICLGVRGHIDQCNRTESSETKPYQKWLRKTKKNLQVTNISNER